MKVWPLSVDFQITGLLFPCPATRIMGLSVLYWGIVFILLRLSMPLMLLQKIRSQVAPLSAVRQRLCLMLPLLKVSRKTVVFSGTAKSGISVILVSIKLI